MATQRLMSSEAIAAAFGPLTRLPQRPAGLPDSDAIKAHHSARTLWTLVDGPYGPLLSSGFHAVNQLAHWCSAKPVPPHVIIDEAPDDALVVCATCASAWDSDLHDCCPYCKDAEQYCPMP